MNYNTIELFEDANLLQNDNIVQTNNTSVELYNDDCLNILKNIPDSTVDLIVTDPPYEMGKISSGGTINNIAKLNKSLKSLEDADIISGYDIETFNTEFIRVMREINIYLWCNKAQIPKYFDFYVNKHKCTFDILCWHKSNALPTYSNKYLTDTEYLLYFRKGKGKCFPKCYEDAKTYYISSINYKDKKLYKHPSIKPLDLTEKIISNSSKENQVVLDPFMGSGTTGVACKHLHRNFIGIELNKQYFDIAKNRINF